MHIGISQNTQQDCLRLLAETFRLGPGIIKQEMTTVGSAYLEIIDLIALGTTPQAVLNFRPSTAGEQRIAELVEREKTLDLSTEEKAELDHFMELEHVLRMAKARAR